MTGEGVGAPAAQRAEVVGETHRLRLFDMHCHLGFSRNPRALAEALAARGVGCWSMTVTPAEYGEQVRPLEGARTVRLGAGLHPWWVAGDAGERAWQLEVLEPVVASTRFVGEVGLDFSRRGIAPADAQEQAFREIARWCAAAGGRAVSIHAVGSGAAGRVLDLLEGARFFADGANAAVFHWFSGSSDELVRARDLGCLFSVGERMLSSKRGRAYVRQLPEDRLLLETDLPERRSGDAERPVLAESAAAVAEAEAETMRLQLEEALSRAAELRGADVAKLAETVAASSRRLLRFGEGPAVAP